MSSAADPRPAPRRPLAQWLYGAVLAAVAAVAAALVLALAVGWHPLVVQSGSMAPALVAGDLIFVRPAPPAAVVPGDVVTFRDPTRGGQSITHRAVVVDRVGASVAFVTKGDANEADEAWSVPADGTVGLLAWRVPRTGRALHVLASPVVRGGLIAVGVALLAAAALRRIWHSPTPPAGTVGEGQPRGQVATRFGRLNQQQAGRSCPDRAGKQTRR